MARRDVELVIRAKDQAAKAVKAITSAIDALSTSQNTLGKSSKNTDTALSRLGIAVAGLDKQFRGLTVAAKIAAELDKAEKASKRLEKTVKSTADELKRLATDTDKASAANTKLQAESTKAGASIKRQAAAVKVAKAAQTEFNGTLNRAVAARNKLVVAEQRLAGQVTAQQAKVAAASAKYKTLGATIEQTVGPTKRLQQQFTAANNALTRHTERLEVVKGKYATTKVGIASATGEISRLKDSLASASGNFAKQNTALATAKTKYTELKGSAKAAADQLRRLNADASKTKSVLEGQNAALEKSQVEMKQLAVAAGQADKALAALAGKSGAVLKQAFDKQRRALLETRREWKKAEVSIASLARTTAKIGPPTLQVAEAMTRARIEAARGKQEYLAQRDGLNQLSQVLRKSGTDIDSLRAKQQQFVAIQGRTGAALVQIRAKATQAASSNRVLAAATAQAAGGLNRVSNAARRAGAANQRAAGQTNALSASFKRIYGDTRKSLSFLQRLRGQVLATIAAYGGFQGVVRLLGATLAAYQKLEAATSRLRVVLDGDQPKVVQELDFIRRTANRLGLEMGALAQEYTKFAIATKGTNLEGAKTRKIFVSVAEAGRVAKLSTEQVKRVFVALTQIASKGTVQMEELRQQLGDSIPGAIQIMARAAGFGVDEIDKFYKAIQDGQVSADTLLEFADELDTLYGDQLGKALQTTTAQLGKLQNAAFQALLAFGEAGVIPALTRLFKELTETLQAGDFQSFAVRVSAAVGTIIDAVTLLLSNWRLVVVAFGAVAGAKLIPFFFAAAVAVKRFVVATAAIPAAMAASRAGMTLFAASTGTATTALTGLRIAWSALIASTGVGIFLAAVGAGVALWATRTDEATDAMAEHLKQVDAVKNAYDKAGGSVEDWASEIKNLTVTEAVSNLERLIPVAEEIQASFDRFDPGLRDIGVPVRAVRDFKELTDAVQEGELSAAAFRKAFDELAQKHDFSLELRESVKELTDSLYDAQEAVTEQKAVLDVLRGTTDENTTAVLKLRKATDDAAGASKKFDSALDDLNDQVAKVTDGLKKMKGEAELEEAFSSAAKAAITIGQLQLAVASFNTGIAAIGSGKALKGLAGITDKLEAASKFIREREGFISTAAFDVNAQRAGFGSDTTTLSDGTIKKITAGMRVSVADSNRDLRRRLTTEFLPKVVQRIGKDNFETLDASQTAVLASLAYNFGNLPRSIAKVIKDGGTPKEVADAIRALGQTASAKRKNLTGRRNLEAGVFEGAGTPQTVEARAKAQVKADAEAAKIAAKIRDEEIKAAEKKNELADSFHEKQALTLENQQFELDNSQKDLLTRETAKALREAELAAQKAGTVVTDEERQKIIEITEARFREKAILEAKNATLQTAKDAEERVNQLLAQRAELEKQIAIYKEQGNTEKTVELKEELLRVNEQLIAATQNAIAMHNAIGGSAADTSIAKLQTTALEARNLAASGGTAHGAWARVGDLFASGLTNAFDQFAQAVANGEDVGEAARKAFLKFASDFLRQIAQMIIKQAIMNALKAFGGGGGGGSAFGSLFGAGHTGGIVGSKRIGSGNRTRRVDPGVFAGAQRFHDGGLIGLNPNETAAILKKNEEVLTESDPRNALNGGLAPTAAPAAAPVIKVVNAIDGGSFLSEGLNSKVGEKALLNFMKANAGAVSAALS